MHWGLRFVPDPLTALNGLTLHDPVPKDSRVYVSTFPTYISSLKFIPILIIKFWRSPSRPTKVERPRSPNFGVAKYWYSEGRSSIHSSIQQTLQGGIRVKIGCGCIEKALTCKTKRMARDSPDGRSIKRAHLVGVESIRRAEVCHPKCQGRSTIDASQASSPPKGLMRKWSLRSFSRAFLRIFSTEGRGARLCWEQSKPKGPNGFSGVVHFWITHSQLRETKKKGARVGEYARSQARGPRP